jgi:hypothetical protein
MIEVNSNESLGYNDLNYSGKSNVTVTIKGVGGMRTVSLYGTSNNNMLRIGSGVTLVLDENITLTGRTNDRLVYVNTGGTLIMKQGSKIIGNNNESNYSGGVIVVGGTFTMDGGEISGNSNNSEGGGVNVQQNGIFTMNGGEIKDNEVRSYSVANYTTVMGGGVYIQGGTFTMNGGKIYDNRCYTLNGGSGNSNHNAYGGGVSLGSPTGTSATWGTFIMNGGEIYNNSAESMNAYGGGIYVRGDFTMSSGKIYANFTKAAANNVDGGTVGYPTYYSEGGGVYVTRVNNVIGGSFTMTSGEISGNTALAVYSTTQYGYSSYGGGAYINDNTSFSKTGGTITGYISSAATGNAVKIGTAPDIANGKGHAVFVSDGAYKDGTSEAGDNLTYTDRGSNPPLIQGSWDN